MPPETLQLANRDYIGIILYLGVILAIGFYFRRFSSKGMDNYFLAGRRLPGWVNGFSAAATAMNADVAPTYCGMTVICGLFIYWFFISRFSLGLIIAALLFAVFWWRLGLFTSPEFYEIRFAGRAATVMRAWIAFRSAFISIVAWTGAGLLGLHKVLHPTLGWSLGATVGIVVPVVLVYVFLSGYMGVVLSDVIQALIVMVSYLVLAIAVLRDFGGPQGLYAALATTHGPEVLRWYPPLKHEMLGLIGVIAWTIGTAIGYGGDAAPMGGAMEGQRIFSSRSGRDASRMYLWALVILFVMLTLLTLPALGAMVRWPGLYTGAINRELAFGLLIARYMPSGLLWLAIAGMAASIMSTIDSNLNFGSQVVVADIYRRFIRPQAAERHYLVVGRLVMFLIMGMAIWVAAQATNVIDIAVFMLGISSAELSANWAQWWWWRFNAPARLAASFGGPLIFILLKYLILPAANPYWHVLGGVGLTTALWISVALLTRPDNEHQLVEFYRRTRPPGFWNPIACQAGLRQSGGGIILRGLAIAVCGVIALTAVTIGVFHTYVGRWGIAIPALAAGTGVALIFRRLYRRFMTRLDPE